MCVIYKFGECGHRDIFIKKLWCTPIDNYITIINFVQVMGIHFWDIGSNVVIALRCEIKDQNVDATAQVFNQAT